MAYNKAKEEYKWKKWKEEEERILRQEGVSEAVIEKLREHDWETFKSERRFREHQAPFPDESVFETVTMGKRDITGIQGLLDAIDNERLLHILVSADKKVVQILLLKMMGYTIVEIAASLEMSEKAVYCRVDRLKKKIKKIYG